MSSDGRNTGERSNRIVPISCAVPRILFSDTNVSHSMGTDANTGDDRMEKINVRVPKSLLDRIDEEWERRGYASKSEAIRDALRDWVDPSVTLSEETLSDLAESREQAERDETVSAEDARERLGLDD